MTREEAIKWMEEAIQDTNTYWDSCSEALQKELNEQREVFLLAIDALLHADRKQKLEAENMKLKERIINWRKYMAPTREQVEMVWRGEWIEEPYFTKSERNRVIRSKKCICSVCNKSNRRKKENFCPYCGAPMTDEAVQMVMKRLEAMKDGKDD